MADGDRRPGAQRPCTPAFSQLAEPGEATVFDRANAVRAGPLEEGLRARLPRGPDATDAERLVLWLVRLLLGTAELGTSAVLRSAAGSSPAAHDVAGARQPALQGPFPVVRSAALAITMEVGRRAMAVVTAAGGTGARRLSRATAAARTSSILAPLRISLLAWAERGRSERAANELVAVEAIGSTLESITAFVADHVELDAVISRVDVDAIVRQLDLASLASDVMADLQVGEIVRETGGTLVVETVDAIRAQGAAADNLVSGVVDRLLRRRPGRGQGAQTAEPGAALDRLVPD